LFGHRNWRHADFGREQTPLHSVRSRVRARGHASRFIRLTSLAAVLAGGVGLVPSIPVSATTVTPTLVATIGGPGHATIYPSGVEVAPDGSIVAADTGNDQIVKYDSAGNQLWRVGAPGSANNQYLQPRDVGVDSSGNVYVADEGNNRVDKLSPSGSWIGSWKGPSTDHIGPPIGLTVANDVVYVADPNKNRIHVFDTSGNELRFLVSNGACVINRLRDVTADAAGNVYVANYVADTILKFGPTGTCLTTWGTKGSGNGQFMNPYGITVAFDPVLGANAVYVADSNNDRIEEFLTDGTFEASIGTAGTTPGTFTQLRRVAVATDGSGDVWGADLWGYRLERFARSAGGYSYAQTIGGTPPPLTTSAVFNQVRAVTFDGAGNLYTMDTVNQRVVEWTAGGASIIRACGQRGFTSTGDFNWPRGLAIDPATGQMWIADTKQSDIQILQADCTPVAKFGTQGSGLSQLNWPYSIVIRQSDGTAWIADTINNRVLSYSVATRAPISSFGGLNQPGAVAVAPGTGHIFVADTKNNRVLELSDTGGSAITLVRALTDGFNKPLGVAVDASGLIYVADSGNSRVVILNTDGTEAAVIKNGFKKPEDVSIDAGGNLYVSDTYNDRVLEYSIALAATTKAAVHGLMTAAGATTPVSLPTFAGNLLSPGLADMYPVSVANDSSYYYVLDPGRFRVVKVNRTTGAIDAQVGGTQGTTPGSFGDARGIAIDSTGNVYVADTPNNRIEKFTSALAFTTMWGTKGSGNGQFNQAYGVAVGNGIGTGGLPAEVLYATDGAGRVEKFDLNGNFLGQFGSGLLAQPRALAVDPNNGDVYVVNAAKEQVDVFDDAGNWLFMFGGNGTGNGQFNNEPRGIAVTTGADATVYVTDSGGRRVEAFNEAGTFQFVVGGPSAFVGPRGLTVTADGDLLVTDEWNFSLKEFTLAGTLIRKLFATGPAVPGVDSPRGIEFDPVTGRIVVDDYWNQRIETVNPDGSGAIAFGFRGVRTQAGSLNFAWDVAVQDSTGRYFVANRESNDIVVFDASGNFITKWGIKGTGPGQMTFPQGVDFAPDGTLIVVDSGNNRLERFSIDVNGNGTFVAAYGSKGTTSMGPGFLNVPTGVSVAPDGTIWVADTLNNSVQSLAPDGTTWTRFWKGTSATLALHIPWGVSVSPDGNVWIADTGSNDIVKMTPTGTLIFRATGDQLGAGPLNGPTSVTFVTNGHTYVSDIWNNRVIDLVGQ
jgi:DNA-binding beta-propeller fold protein YncE